METHDHYLIYRMERGQTRSGLLATARTLRLARGMAHALDGDHEADPLGYCIVVTYGAGRQIYDTREPEDD